MMANRDGWRKLNKGIPSVNTLWYFILCLSKALRVGVPHIALILWILIRSTYCLKIWNLGFSKRLPVISKREEQNMWMLVVQEQLKKHEISNVLATRHVRWHMNLICNRLLLNLVKYALMNNRRFYRRNRSVTLQILTIRRILGVWAKKPWGNNINRSLLQGILLHTQREDGSNTSHQRPPQRNRCCHNDAI